MAKTEEIVLIGGSDKIGQEVTKLISTLPPAVQALTGVDISGVKLEMKRISLIIHFRPLVKSQVQDLLNLPNKNWEERKQNLI